MSDKAIPAPVEIQSSVDPNKSTIKDQMLQSARTRPSFRCLEFRKFVPQPQRQQNFVYFQQSVKGLSQIPCILNAVIRHCNQTYSNFIQASMDLLIPIVPVNQECVLARETAPDVLREPLINHLETNKTPARETDNFNTHTVAVKNH